MRGFGAPAGFGAPMGGQGFGIAAPAPVVQPTAASAAMPVPVDSTTAAAATALPVALQAVTSIIGPKDAYEDAGVIEAKIKNYKAMKARLPALAWWYDNEIAKLQAKLTAAKRRAALQAEGEQATREWRSLGYALAAGGVLVLVGGAVALARVGR